MRFREYLSGHGELMRQLAKKGFEISGVEAYPGGLYVSTNDSNLTDVVEPEEKFILTGELNDVHFGTVCLSWSPISRINKRTRRLAIPEGNGELLR